MNNGMFVEMCAYIANRDIEKVEYSQEPYEPEPEISSSGVITRSQTTRGLTDFGRLVKTFFQSISNGGRKQPVKNSQAGIIRLEK